MPSEALCFDMFGTLCDPSGVAEALQDQLALPDAVVDDVETLWRRKQLQYSYQLAQMDAYRPFCEVTRMALDYALAYYGQDSDEVTRAALLDAYQDLDPYPDTLDTLRRLDGDRPLAVLSNGDPDMLATLAERTGIDEHVGHVISAHEVETFKPSPPVYENAADRLGRDLADSTLVSSNAWDVAGAAHAGMGTVWVDRDDEPMERVGGDPDRVVGSLLGLVEG